MFHNREIYGTLSADKGVETIELSLLICDDASEDRRRMRQMIQLYGERRGYRIRLEEAASGEELLSRWRPNRWDLILLDMYMTPGLTGEETARRLRLMDKRCEIAFVTISEEHGLAGYELELVDYLVKPVDRETLFDMLDWFICCQWERLRTLTVRSEWEEMEVRLRDIIYIEIQRHTARISLHEKTIYTRRGMAELEEEIGNVNFLRCHRSFLVNLAHVTAIQKKDFVMDNGSRVPISAAKVADCRKTMVEWLLGKRWNCPDLA